MGEGRQNKSPSNQERDSTVMLKAVFDSAIDGIITINESGIIETANPAAGHLFGYNQEELIGANISMLMPEPHHSAHDDYLKNYLNTGERHIIGIGREVQGKRKDGTVFPFRLAISEAWLSNRRIFTGVIHDLSHEKDQERRLRAKALDLERSNKELQNFAYVSSHDLQEPLRKIQAFGSRIQNSDADKLSQKGNEYLERMMRAAQRMQTLINDLLTFSRLNTRARPFQQVDLNMVLKEAVSDLEILIQQAGATIEAVEMPTIEGDHTQLRQLFQNLISNAVKFSQAADQAWVKVTWRELPPRNGQKWIEISISDNGVGFEEKYLDRIFDVFQQLDGRKYGGSGIGLAICRRIVHRHQGEITARSDLGEGATFLVSLPCRQPNNELSEAPITTTKENQ